MPLSERTMAEMRAGAEAVAKAAGATGMTEEYMEALLRTQVRAAWLTELDKSGRIRIEREMRPHTSDRTRLEGRTVVWVGDNRFADGVAEITGAFPSEVLCAQIALALGAGEDKKSDTDNLVSMRGVAYYLGEPVRYNAAKDMFETKLHSWTREEYTKLCARTW